jgi:hypothetical protein
MSAVRTSDLTIGPYLAASLAAGEVFGSVRLNDYSPERPLFLTASDYSHGPEPSWSVLDGYGEPRSTLLVGVGAVGAAMLHALYPLSLRGTILVADHDAKGCDHTNLARYTYTLFGSAAVGKQKASHAAQLLHKTKFRVVPHDGGFEHFFTGLNKPTIVLSAVDINSSRHALQEQHTTVSIRFYIQSSSAALALRAAMRGCLPRLF